MADRIGRRIVEGLVVAFATLYVGATILGMIDRTYQMPLSLHGIMGTIISYLFFTGFIGRGTKDEDKAGNQGDSGDRPPDCDI